jgi:hypothetical protein
LDRLVFLGAHRPALPQAQGGNPNPYFFTPPTPAPLVSPEAKPFKLEERVADFVYDLPTKAGEVVALKRKG